MRLSHAAGSTLQQAAGVTAPWARGKAGRERLAAAKQVGGAGWQVWVCVCVWGGWGGGGRGGREQLDAGKLAGERVGVGCIGERVRRSRPVTWAPDWPSPSGGAPLDWLLAVRAVWGCVQALQAEAGSLNASQQRAIATTLGRSLTLWQVG